MVLVALAVFPEPAKRQGESLVGVLLHPLQQSKGQAGLPPVVAVRAADGFDQGLQ